jgi:hypothetical protein
MEIYEDLLARRIDANLTNIALSDIPENIDHVERLILAAKAKEKFGTLFIKEFPPNGVNCNQIRAYLRELELKKNFKGVFYGVGNDLYHNDKKVLTIDGDNDSINSIIAKLKSKIKKSKILSAKPAHTNILFFIPYSP